MTVFRPQQFNEIWGIRFWTSQCVRYAGYKDSESGEILGDIANADFTSYLIEQKLWTPPVEKCAFDVLPLVIKLPGNDIPFVYELPKAVTHDIHIEHPKFNKVKDLGFKWTAVPVINNFSLTLGGIHYTAAPFNGWFMTTEIARNLLERYGATNPLAIAMGFDLTDKLLARKVSAELESAILYSFEKGKTTVVDPDTVGHSFVTHCKREQSAGRECPAQWSWVGGLVGKRNREPNISSYPMMYMHL
jgi:nitric oxide synthase oxygenase domain/subunit